MLENPQWYTAYTPYQAEISQGRLEMLLNFQTMVCELTGMDVSNCSLLDEGSAAGEALHMANSLSKGAQKSFFVAQDCHPQTIGCVQTRGENSGVKVVVGDPRELLPGGKLNPADFCGALIQYPNSLGSFGLGSSGADPNEHSTLSKRLKEFDCKFVVATDLLACTWMKSPGELGADMVVGSAQRFGVPMFFGGPHAGFMASKTGFVRHMPGRIIGVSKDAQNRPALRMALQTREQFIRREKATSNICTAQALLANIAAAYAIYHGPEGIAGIAQHTAKMARMVEAGALHAGYTRVTPKDAPYFDTVTLRLPSGKSAKDLQKKATEAGFNLRVLEDLNAVGISTDETHSVEDIKNLLKVMAKFAGKNESESFNAALKVQTPVSNRATPFLTHKVFDTFKSETQMLRYLTSLEAKDLTLRQAMIPLGSCTMKLNSVSELMPVSFPEFANMHPFAPEDQTKGYQEMITRLNKWLASLTGFVAVSAQPNSGATGEYAGLLCIKRYHEANGQAHRTVCLIPSSAHGTNPASAAMCGMKVVGVKSDSEGNVDLVDLKEKAVKYGSQVSALMVTYPSTYGKYEEGVKEAIQIVHDVGGLVYMDGANMNAQLGLTSPGRIGADVCHLNLHKTFAIPHGGGGPGVGSIAVNAKLAPFLPGHPVVPVGGEGPGTKKKSTGAVTAAPYGSAGILPIPYMFIRMMGREGLKNSSRVAMLNANYMAKRLEENGAYKILFKGQNGMVAHEFIVDLRFLKEHHLDETDVAKRLADFGFHAPTMSWPVGGTMMVEPTESEDKHECDRFVNALLEIKKEIDDVVSGKVKAEDSPLKHAPHTSKVVLADKWDRKYSRERAAFPPGSAPLGVKYWPHVGRVDNVHGDRNLVCSCPPVEAFE
jgi:glycine dehydrogenase